MLKKLLGLFTLSLLLIVGILPVNAYADEIHKGMDAYEEDLELPSDAQITINEELGLVIVSTKVDEKKASRYYEEIELVDVDFKGQVGPESEPQKPTSATFSHNIYDRNGILVATAYVTIEGVYSEVEQWSEITDITVNFEGELAQDFSYTSSISGDTGTVKIYFNGANAGGFKYKIYYNGRIDNI